MTSLLSLSFQRQNRLSRKRVTRLSFKRWFSRPKKLLHTVFCGILASSFVILPTTPGMHTEARASGGDRTLWVHYTHTGERERITFRKNGHYVQEGLDRLNWLTRDWRRNTATKMDPRLFDLVWSIYQESGATQPIMIVSGYRSKKTNDALRRRSRGVARVSQHTAGKAMDFYIPGVPARRLREIGLKMQIGGVGYYPGSRTPFVHMDTGRVRHWPRMSPTQLARLFPDGKTLHTSTTGRRLPKYDEALKEYRERLTKVVQPLTRSKRTRVARNDDRGFLGGLFNRDRDESTEPARSRETRGTVVAATSPPVETRSTAPTTIRASVSETSVVAARVPAPRALPDDLRDTPVNDNAIVVASAPSPVERPVTTPEVPTAVIATAALALPTPNPTPRSDTPEQPEPTVIAARTDLEEDDTTPIPSRILTEDTAGTAIITPSGIIVRDEPAETTTIAEAKPEPEQATPATPEDTPTIVTAALPRENESRSDPTQLLFNNTSDGEEAPSSIAATLAYAAANDPVETLPTLDAEKFNQRFGQFRIGSDLDGVPLRPETAEASVFAALGGAPQALFPPAELTGASDDTITGAVDYNEPVGEPLALLPSSVIEAELPTPTVDEPVIIPEVPTQAAEAAEESKPLDDIVPSVAVIDAIAMRAPEPDKIPELFRAPTLAFAGTFKPRAPSAEKTGFSGTAVHPTPTIRFADNRRTRISQRSE